MELALNTFNQNEDIEFLSRSFLNLVAESNVNDNTKLSDIENLVNYFTVHIGRKIEKDPQLEYVGIVGEAVEVHKNLVNLTYQIEEARRDLNEQAKIACQTLYGRFADHDVLLPTLLRRYADLDTMADIQFHTENVDEDASLLEQNYEIYDRSLYNVAKNIRNTTPDLIEYGMIGLVNQELQREIDIIGLQKYCNDLGVKLDQNKHLGTHIVTKNATDPLSRHLAEEFRLGDDEVGVFLVGHPRSVLPVFPVENLPEEIINEFATDHFNPVFEEIDSSDSIDGLSLKVKLSSLDKVRIVCRVNIKHITFRMTAKVKKD